MCLWNKIFKTFPINRKGFLLLILMLISNQKLVFLKLERNE